MEISLKSQLNEEVCNYLWSSDSCREAEANALHLLGFTTWIPVEITVEFSYKKRQSRKLRDSVWKFPWKRFKRSVKWGSLWCTAFALASRHESLDTFPSFLPKIIPFSPIFPHDFHSLWYLYYCRWQKVSTRPRSSKKTSKNVSLMNRCVSWCVDILKEGETAKTNAFSEGMKAYWSQAWNYYEWSIIIVRTFLDIPLFSPVLLLYFPRFFSLIFFFFWRKILIFFSRSLLFSLPWRSWS